MTNRDFEQLVTHQLNHCIELLGVKGEEYDTTEDDRLHAFKVAAQMQHVTQAQALAGMMAKHSVSIYDMCAEDSDASLEKWTEKITDSINYLLLLKAIIVEEKSKEEIING